MSKWCCWVNDRTGSSTKMEGLVLEKRMNSSSNLYKVTKVIKGALDVVLIIQLCLMMLEIKSSTKNKNLEKM